MILLLLYTTTTTTTNNNDDNHNDIIIRKCVCVYICIYIYIYMYIEYLHTIISTSLAGQGSSPLCAPPPGSAVAASGTRDWRNTVRIVLFEILTSMKPDPSVFHAYTNDMRPTIGFFEPTNLDEVSNRIPPPADLAREYTWLISDWVHF